MLAAVEGVGYFVVIKVGALPLILILALLLLLGLGVAWLLYRSRQRDERDKEGK